MQLENVSMDKRRTMDSPALWLDARKSPDLVSRALQSGYNGVVGDLETLERIAPFLSERLNCVIEIEESADLEKIESVRSKPIVASRRREILGQAAARGLKTAYRAYVDDNASLHDAIHLGQEHSYVVMAFKDPTNIPLELVIASLQSTQTVLIKEIDPQGMEDALVTRGVMEVGADGILFSPPTHEVLEQFLKRWKEVNQETLVLEEGEILRSVPVGMGYRSCIDLATLFTPTEGMLVGSTSQGGILCCPEVFHLPYMELRPFRVNAGAVHSYVFNMGNRTDYMTELRAGSSVMIVDHSGSVRKAHVGRMKTEIRPLRLIDAGFSDGRKVNLLLQDDWHVRIYSAEGKPLNITELKVGDRILGNVTDPGRHVGIKVSENILEN